jgi:hypothetical protein
MAELLQGDDLSPAEMKLNELRMQRLEDQERYQSHVHSRLGEVATNGPRFVSARDSYWAHEQARADVKSERPEQHQ